MRNRVDFKRDELRMVWEQKCLCLDEASIKCRMNTAVSRLRARGILDPTPTEVRKERERLEEERFSEWLLEKQLRGFDRA